MRAAEWRDALLSYYEDRKVELLRRMIAGALASDDAVQNTLLAEFDGSHDDGGRGVSRRASALVDQRNWPTSY